MKTLSLMLMVVVLTNCATTRHYHDDTRESEDCNYVMQLTPRACELEHHDRSKGAIHTWTSSETFNSQYINSNFQHIHNNMVGGHGGRLVDADVAAGANIAASKLATNRGIPRAWAQVGDPAVAGLNCTAGTCVLAAAYNVTRVLWIALGLYTVDLSYNPVDTNFMVLANAVDSSAADGFCMVRGITGTTAPHFTISCEDGAGAQMDAKPAFVVYDNN